MKRTVLIVLAFGALAFSSSAYAQSNAQLIEGALSAAPGRADTSFTSDPTMSRCTPRCSRST